MFNNQAIENITIFGLFPFKGKIGRLKFIIGALIIFFLFIFPLVLLDQLKYKIIYLSFGEGYFEDKFTFVIFLIVWLLSYSLWILLVLSISIRRLNDIGLPSSLAFIIPISTTIFCLIGIRKYIGFSNYDHPFIKIMFYGFFGSAFLTAILLFLLCVGKGIQKKDDYQHS